VKRHGDVSALCDRGVRDETVLVRGWISSSGCLLHECRNQSGPVAGVPGWLNCAQREWRMSAYLLEAQRPSRQRSHRTIKLTAAVVHSHTRLTST
jgi:hypothetical protein